MLGDMVDEIGSDGKVIIIINLKALAGGIIATFFGSLLTLTLNASFQPLIRHDIFF